jgi:site-specific recombinase XerD
MTPLRAKFIQDLVIRGRSKTTQKAYTRCVCDLARYYRRSPELISYEEVTGWLHHLIKERQLAASSVNIAVSAVRFLYGVTLGRETLDLMASVSDMKRATGRADSEVEAILTPPRQSCGRPVTPLRAKYIRDLVIRGRSKNTQEAYIRYVRDLARYYRRSPELISYEEVTDWLYHLIKERKLSASSVNIAVSAVRFLYGVTLGRETLDLMASVPHMKRATRRAEVYARSEVEAILTAPRQPRDRVLLMTVYGCGLRISEATQLKTSDIDRARMQLRVRDGKGAKGRVLPLSERLLKSVRKLLASATSG